MNQAIQFPDRESWDAERQGVVFPALVNGMQLTCAISGQILQQRFGAEGQRSGWPPSRNIVGIQRKRQKH